MPAVKKSMMRQGESTTRKFVRSYVSGHSENGTARCVVRARNNPPLSFSRVIQSSDFLRRLECLRATRARRRPLPADSWTRKPERFSEGRVRGLCNRGSKETRCITFDVAKEDEIAPRERERGICKHANKR